MKTGRLIVIEGIDGSGKSTQVKLLKQYLASQGLTLQVLSFPRYEENLYGKLIKRYLEGEFGTIGEVDPHLVALAFAGDRILAKPLMDQWLAEGKTVLANRYVSSNKAHLGANLPAEKRAEFISWLDQLEYGTNKLPKADLTILLTVDPRLGQRNVADSHRPDLHEENLKYLEQAQVIFLQLAKQGLDWYIVDCMKNSDMKTPQEIHQEIKEILEKL